jgi:hypothetical protein
MGAYIGFIGLAILFLGLPLVYFLRKSRERAMKAFYKEHSLFLTMNTSPKIREHLKINENPYCCQVNLKLTSGAKISVYWCEWFIRTEIPGRTTASVQINYYLAIFFAPNLVSDDFMRKAIEFADKSEVGVMQKIRDQFAPDTHYPFRAEKLADGTFLICWEMIKRREIYESRLAWLQNNVSINQVNAVKSNFT